MAERLNNDAYQTPPALCAAICDSLANLSRNTPPGVVIEPSAGAGNFVRAAHDTWDETPIIAVDIDPTYRAACLEAGASAFIHTDWAMFAASGGVTSADGRALVLGNPPFLLAQAHVEAGLRVMRPGDELAFLLRMSFLGGGARARTLWAGPGLRYLQPITPRPSFTGGGTDTAEYALFIWEKGYAALAELLPPLVWRAPARERLEVAGG